MPPTQLQLNPSQINTVNRQIGRVNEQINRSELPGVTPLTQINPEVDARQLTNRPTRVQLQQPRVATTPQRFVDNLAPSIEAGQQGLLRLETEEAEERQDVLNRIISSDSEGAQQEFRSAFDRARGPQAVQQLRDASTRLAQLQGKFRSAGQRISGGEGQSKVFEATQLGELGRQEAIEVGNQALLVQALQGNVDTARQIALDTANFASEDRRIELQNLLSQFDALDSVVSGQEAQLLEQRRLETQEELANLQETKDAVNAAINSGAADIDELQQLTSDQLPDAEKRALAQQIVGRGASEARLFERDVRGLDLSNQELRNQLLREQITSEQLSRPVESGGAEFNIQELFTNFGDGATAASDPSAVAEVIFDSAKYGGKRMNDAQLEKVQQATQALGSLESLQNLLIQGDDGLNLTGPIAGRARTLLTQIGTDATAAQINATIQGLIPTVARGIFGEVGVLTDADINNYRKTLPNLNQTADQNRLISLVMYDVLGRSLGSTLASNAQNQANVSNFLPTYVDVVNRVDAAKRGLGVTQATGFEDEDVLDLAESGEIVPFSGSTTPFIGEFSTTGFGVESN